MLPDKRRQQQRQLAAPRGTPSKERTLMVMETESRPVGLPRLNEPAPAFEAVTTHGTLTLADFQGRWLILFSHPADFTPVCTTEFMAFAEIFPQLQERGTDLLGLSIDSVYSHIAWVRNIEEKTGVRIPFPVIADLNKEVATSYGMLMPGESKTETSRCVFFIDPKGVLRAMIYYPLSLGRDMAEVLRVIDALQTADKHGVATPANWKPGDRVIVPAPSTQEMAEERMQAGYECVDWYLCKKDV
jgi:peroxiredoxin (alkyl hydroperoxide reductase subunit C)